MATIETIGVGGKYATIQDWYDAHKGDITSDPDAPYIGELLPQVFDEDVAMKESTTDADHYFHLRARANYEFKGNFAGAGVDFPMVRPTGTVGFAIDLTDDYTRMEHFVVGDRHNTATDSVAGFYSTADYTLLDGVGVWNLSMATSGTIVGVSGITTGAGTYKIRNCAVAELQATGPFAASVTGIRVGAAGTESYYVYNNSVHNLVALGGAISAAYGIVLSDNANADAYNNCVGYLEGASEAFGIEDKGTTGTFGYNATMDATGGSNSQDNIVPADEFFSIASPPDLRVRAGGQCENNGLNLREVSADEPPTEDCLNIARPDTGLWSIGISLIGYSPTPAPDSLSISYSSNVDGPGVEADCPGLNETRIALALEMMGCRPFLERAELLQAQRMPGPRIDPAKYKAHEFPIEPPLPNAEGVNYLTGAPPPDRGQTYPWPHPEEPEDE